jgi:disease resistance protein RPM1
MCDIRWKFSNKSECELQPLGHLDSEKLFLKKLFGHEASCPNAHTNVIKEILTTCGHNPSAIVSIASVLATKLTTTKPWQKVMDSVYSDWKLMARSEYIPDFEDSRYIISLIYMHLPRPLNTCLLHLAVHGKNQMIRRTAMANKWVAEGFIPCGQASDGEILAGMCFDALSRRNLIQRVEYGNYLGEEIYEVNYMMQNVFKKLAHDSGFANVFSGQGCIPLRDLQSNRLLAQYSGSELSIHMEPKYLIPRICSLTIVGPVKIYFNCDQEHLVVLDMDGCKELDNVAMDRICRMIKLKYLSIKHTQVTKITPEIGEMQCLETLDIRQTQISNLPPEIGTLQKLKILNARQTLIRCLPREVGKLQNLETLDVRQTQVKELPKEIVQLPKLAHLYFGQISSLGVVKLPVGSDQLKSVEVFGTVDSREWSESAMEEISGLTGVRELEVVLHDQPVDKIKNDKLLSSIGKCMQLKYLIINGDYNPNDDLLVSPNFPLIEKLKLAGRFVKIPRWLAQHRILKKLDFRVCKLDQDDLKILGGLPLLSTLALALISILRKKRVTITCRLHSSTCTDLHPLRETCPPGFTSLEVFNFDCHVPWITFEQGAMPSLKHLHLKLFACPADKFPSGIINLRSLEKIVLRYSSQHASSGGVTNAVAAMREEASSHRNLICLSVNGYHEDFLPNARVDQTITGTEIKEDSNHGNRIERSINGGPEVLVTRVDETITGTETEEEASNHGDPIKLSVDGDREVLLSNTRADVTIAGTEIKECY